MDKYYTPRVVDAELARLLEGQPAIAVEGPKAVGKTMTLSRLAATTLSLEREAVLDAIRADPNGITLHPKPVFIDEWQQWPQVWNAVRQAVDAGATAGEFLLAGSRIPVGARIHSGAGRIVTLRMRPLSLAERHLDDPTVSLGDCLSGEVPVIRGDAQTSFSTYVRQIAASGFPGINALTHSESQEDRLASYLDAIITKEFPEQGLMVRKPDTLRRWLRSYAAATGTNASYSSILDAATPGESDKPDKTTTLAYRDVLQSLWLIDEVPVWAEGEEFYSRLSTTPKHFLADPALAMTLLELSEADLLSGNVGEPRSEAYGSITGRLFESLVALSLQVYAQANRARLSYFRTRDGKHEIDFIVERRHKVVAIEVKLAQSIDDHDVRHLKWLKEKLGDRLADALMITTGPFAYRRPDGVAVVPASLLGV